MPRIQTRHPRGGRAVPPQPGERPAAAQRHLQKTKAAGSDTIAGDDGVRPALPPTASPSRSPRAWPPTRTCGSTWPASKAARTSSQPISRGTTEAADVFATGPLDTLKEAYHHGTEFLGYQTTEADGDRDRHPRAGPARRVGRPLATAGPPIALVLDRTPFYGEAGGQVGDTGTIRGDGFVFQVEDTKKDNDFILHIGRVTEGTVNRRTTRRRPRSTPTAAQAIRRAHSATHVLHHALHRHLGKHAQQAGSKVEPDRLRFDFANPEAVGKERLDQIEKTVNALVMTGSAVSWTLMPIAEAKTLGAMALFGEKYPDIVRVVQMGEFSRELCGGTHLDNVGQVGLFKIIGEESVAAGHSPDHRADRPGGARLRPPGGGGPRRRSPRPCACPRPRSATAWRPCSRRSRPSRSRPPSAEADDGRQGLRRRPAGRRDVRRRRDGGGPGRRRTSRPTSCAC